MGYQIFFFKVICPGRAAKAARLNPVRSSPAAGGEGGGQNVEMTTRERVRSRDPSCGHIFLFFFNIGKGERKQNSSV